MIESDCMKVTAGPAVLYASPVGTAPADESLLGLDAEREEL